MTANSFVEDVREAAAGMNAHGSKPIDLPVLLAALHKALPPRAQGRNCGKGVRVFAGEGAFFKKRPPPQKNSP